jgi:DNA-binding response OmpR family regulator
VSSQPAAPSARILVVDDVSEMAEILQRRLTARGYNVDTVNSGAKAIAALPRGGYDLVLLDVMMPDMSGLELLKRVREVRKEHQLPVIMVSARDDQAAIVQCLAAGANDYVVKPYDFGILLARVVNHLKIKSAFDAMVKQLAAARAA